MHRNRVWNTSVPLQRTARNRILPIDGVVPAVDTLFFTPSDIVLDNTIAGAQTLTPTFGLNYLETVVQFKYLAPRLPAGVTVYWKKNGGAFIAWPTNTLNGANFTRGDTLTVGVNVSGIAAGSDFAITLYNNIDTAPCSNVASILISGVDLGAP
jgi:hypothetical protein